MNKRVTSSFTFASYNKVFRQHYSVSGAAWSQRGFCDAAPALQSAPCCGMLSTISCTWQVPVLRPWSQCSVLEQQNPRAEAETCLISPPIAPLLLLPVWMSNALEKGRLHSGSCPPTVLNLHRIMFILALQSCKLSIQECRQWKLILFSLNTRDYFRDFQHFLMHIRSAKVEHLTSLFTKGVTTLSEYVLSQKKPMQPL